MAKCVDRDELLHAIGELPLAWEYGQAVAEIYEIVKNAPTINPDDLRPRGQWVGEGDGYADGELVFDVWYCSECNYCIDDGTDDPDMLPNYCSNCGAKMENEK